VRLFILTGNRAKARERIAGLDDRLGRQADVKACLASAIAAEVENLAEKRVAPRPRKNPDSETGSGWTNSFAFCGQEEIAMQLLRVRSRGTFAPIPACKRTIFCASANTPEFAELLTGRQTVPRQFHRREIASPALKLTVRTDLKQQVILELRRQLAVPFDAASTAPRSFFPSP